MSVKPPDPRHAPLRDYIAKLYLESNGLTVPWSGRHGLILKQFLQACNWPIDALQTAVQNRFDSEAVNLAEDPLRWISRIPNYAKSPLDRYGKPIYKQPDTSFELWGQQVEERARKQFEEYERTGRWQ